MSSKICQVTEAYVRESGLLSPERMAEVSAEIDRRITPCYDGKGRALKEAFIAKCPEGEMLFARVDSDGQREYLRRSVLGGVLTEAELNLVNERCLDAREARQNEERFAKAKKVDTWDGGVFLGDDYFPTLEDACDRIVADGMEWPTFIWAAKPTTVIQRLDVADAVECQMSDRGWEDMDLHDLRGVAELQAAMDKFLAANADVKSYFPDHTTAVLLDRVKGSAQVTA